MTPQEIQALTQLAREQGLLPMGAPDEIAAALNSQRPKIRLPGDNRELLHFAKEVADVLATRNLFRRDRAPVVVNPEKARLDAMTPQMLRSWSQDHIVYFKEKTVSSGDESRSIDIVKTMNVDTARGLIESWHFIDKLPEIERLNPVRLPVLRANGAIDLTPTGYFSETRTYTLDSGVEYDDGMSLEEAKSALAIELLGEMPYHDAGRSLRVHVGAMLTIFSAGLLPRRSTRPGFVFTANDSDAGKTLAAKMAILPIFGKLAGRGMPRKEETRKVLDQLAMEAAPIAFFDNVKGVLGGEDLEAFMSQTIWSGRVLGAPGGFEVENLTTCFFSGNDAKPTQDMMNRCLFVELFLEDIDSTKRQIKNVMTDAKLAELPLRNRVCSALWTLVKHWDAEGRPPAPTRMPKHPEWSDVIAGIVAAAGFGDLCEKPNIASARGHVHEMRDLVDKLKPDASDGGGSDREEWTFAQIMEIVKTHGLFETVEFQNKKGDQEEMFAGDDLTPAARSFFGKLLSKYHDRAFAGTGGERLRFLVEGKGNQRRYIVVREAQT